MSYPSNIHELCCLVRSSTEFKKAQWWSMIITDMSSAHGMSSEFKCMGQGEPSSIMVNPMLELHQIERSNLIEGVMELVHLGC